MSVRPGGASRATHATLHGCPALTVTSDEPVPADLSDPAKEYATVSRMCLVPLVEAI